MAEDGKRTKHLWMLEESADKRLWTKIGVAFENKDGSYDLHLAAVPVSGKMTMRDPLTPPDRTKETGDGDKKPTG